MNAVLKWLVLFNYLLVVHFYPFCEGLGGMRGGSRMRSRPSVSTACPMPKLKHGTVRMQRGGRMGYFFCANGFDIHGPMNIVCQMGRWKQEIPKCLKSGCKQPQARTNGYVMIDEKKQQAMLFCQDGYLSAGSTNAFCDGSTWDRELGECRPDVQHTKSCDFETSDLCEWTQDGENDFQWLRRNGWTSFEKLEYGPKHDHTSGKPLHGYYMVAEATNSRSTQKSRLWSSVYNQNDSVNACFRFYYHMYGSKIGRLRVLYKPIDLAFDDIVDEPKYQLFEKAHSQGNQWNEAFFEIEPTTDKFQIIFEAAGSNGLINDIAIDDVALLNGGECLQFSKSNVTEEIDGVFGTQSCANRCNETESVRTHSSTALDQNGKIIEKCDCHLECLELDTCCIDYQLKCLESESTELDYTTTPLSDESSESSALDEVTTTPLIETDVNSKRVQNSTVLTTTPKTVVTSTTIKTSISTIISRNTTTPKTITMPVNRLNVTFTPIRISVINLNLTNTKSIPKSTTPTPTPTTFKSLVTKNSAILNTTTTHTSTVPTKVPLRTLKWINVTSTTPKPVVRTSTTPFSIFKPKAIQTIPPLVMKSTAKVRIVTSAIRPKSTTIKFSTRTTTMKPSQSTQKMTTDTTLNAKVMPISETSKIPKISIIIAICIMLSALLFAWKHFTTNKWNSFNSHQIEFKSNYPTEGPDESLISRSDSFQIDNDFIDDETLIDNGRDDDDVTDDSDDENVNPENGHNNVTTDHSNNTLQIGKKAKRAATRAKFLKNSNRCGRICDKYSEKRYLMNSTGDDELFDFTPQTTL